MQISEFLEALQVQHNRGTRCLHSAETVGGADGNFSNRRIFKNVFRTAESEKEWAGLMTTQLGTSIVNRGFN